MRFSERIGKVPVKSSIQLDYMDDDLRNSLWNVVDMFLTEPMQRRQDLSYSGLQPIVKVIWFSFFKEPTDQISYFSEPVASDIRERFFKWDYIQVYDFIDFLASTNDRNFNAQEFLEACNFILKRELSGYRFVNGQLAPITNEQEINEIEKAISHAAGKNLKGVSIHLSAALNKLADKKKPDYRNSIKESISAVESVCQAITGEKKAELGKALKLLKGKLSIHGALEQGFIKLYGYTSDGDGIRHSLLDESNLDQEDALFMLVSCSSFVNYLVTKSEKVGLLEK